MITREGLRAVVDFLLPAACLGCGRRMVPEESHRLWCGPCGARLRPLPSPGCGRCQAPLGTGVRDRGSCRECQEWPPEMVASEAAVALAPPADRLVHALKYEGWASLAGAMAGRMEPAAARLAARLRPGGAGESGLAVVPVPTASGRERSRGYNQAELLAGEVAERLGLPVAPVLERVDQGDTQVTLDPVARRANVRRAFRWKESAARGIPSGSPGLFSGGGAALLVDDVLTTGATAEAAARALASGGIRAVGVLAFARALPEPAPGSDGPADPEALGELLDPVLPGAWERPGGTGGARGPGTGRGEARNHH